MGFVSKFVVGSALAGFTIAVAIGTSAFYLPHNLGVSPIVLLIVCPACLAAVALDNAGRVDAVLGWVSISLGNAALYAAIGLVLGDAIHKPKSK